MKTRVCVSIFIEKDGKFLLGRKKPNTPPYPNTWLTIGGGVELENESIIDAVKREVKEECNIEITNIKKLTFDEDYEPDKTRSLVHYVYLTFSASYASGDLRPGDDIHELQLFTKKQLIALPLPRPTIKVLKELGWIPV